MELNEAVEKFLAAAEEATIAAREATMAARGATAASHATTSAVQRISIDQRLIRRDLNLLWRKTVGQDPPPPPPPGVDLATDPEKEEDVTIKSSAKLPQMITQNSGPPIAMRLDAASSEVDTLRGEMIAGFATLQTELRQQSTAMGLSKKGLEWAMTRQGQKSILAYIAAVSAFVGLLISALRPASIAPVHAPPAPTMIVVTQPLQTASPDAGALIQ